MPAVYSERNPMKPSKHIYMNQEAQDDLEFLKEKLGKSASGVVALALKAARKAVE